VYRTLGLVYRTLGLVYRTLGLVYRTLGLVYRTLGSVYRTLGLVYRTMGLVYRTLGLKSEIVCSICGLSTTHRVSYLSYGIHYGTSQKTSLWLSDAILITFSYTSIFLAFR